MSGSAADIIARPLGIDVLTPLSRWQQLNQSEAQTALTGAQTQQVQTQNALQKLALARQSYLYGMAGIPTGQEQLGAPQGQPGAPPAAAGAPQPSQGGPGDAPQQGAQPGGGSYPGAFAAGVMGFPAPPLQAVAAISATDPVAATKNLSEARRQAIYSAVSGAPPEQYPQAMMGLYQAGWISPDVMREALQHPEGRARVLASTQTPESYQSALNAANAAGLSYDANGQLVRNPTAIAARGAMAGAEAAGRVPAEVAKARATPTTLPGGGFGPPSSVLPPSSVDRLAQPGGAAAGAAPAASIPTATDAAIQSIPAAVQPMAIRAAVRAGLPQEAWAPWIASVQNETGWNLQAPDGAAGEIGVGQVKPGTGQMVGVSPEQLRDPMHNLVASATYFGRQWKAANGDFAQAATGYNTGTTSGTAPKYVADATKQLASWGYPGATTQPAPGVTQRQTEGGAVYTTDTRPQQAEAYKADQALVPQLTEQINNLSQAQQRNMETRDLINKLPQAGAAGGARTAAANFVQTFIAPIPGMGNAAAQFISDSARLPPADLAAELEKLQITAAGLQENAAVGARGGLGLTSLFMRSNPGFGIPQSAGRDLANMNIIGTQMQLDYARGRAQVPSGQPDYIAGKANYIPGTTYDANWVSAPNEQNYYAAVLALNGRPAADWMKAVGGDENRIHTVLGILRRADPTATVKWTDGNTYPVNRMQ